uniref:EOG090X00E0 n=1 Tax=Moina brachiata TaxID=675436 RepID=A0A4Y7NKN8_9CRUS|nr:EOG090X00E0 [Moina brachiata]SVE92835.1 EOG090X00E0 [Moina brachiata]
MGKLKTRIKGPGSKAKRWPKGQSSSSNPTTKKHREAAKGAFFQPFQLYTKPSSEEKGGLTEDILKQHTYATAAQSSGAAIQPEIITAPPSIINGDFGDDETASMHSGVTFRSGSTFKTFASGFTNCSNMSFNKLFRGFTPRSALHKEMLAVLAAVSEVIKQQGGQESDTEYFAALMTTLEVSEVSEDALGATVSLLGMVIKKVPASVLKLKFSSAAKRLLDLLVNHLESDNALLIRSLIGCLGVLLRNQDASVWAFSSTLQFYDVLLTFVTSPKPQVRKAAQHAVCVVLKASPFLTAPDAPLHHPAASRTGKYSTQFIEEHGFGSDSSSVLHLLNLLKEILAVLPQSEVKPLCESLLKLMTLNNVLITSCAMQCFHGLMMSRPRPATLSAELNAKLITALYDYQPSMNDAQPTRAWLTVMTQSLINLSLLDLALCTGHLPRFFGVAAQLWSSDRMDVVHAVTPALSSITNQCLGPGLKDASTASSAKSTADKMIRMIEQSLNYQTVKAWKYIIHLSTVMIDVVGKHQPDLLKDLIKALTSLRVSPNFPYETEVDYAIGKLVRVCGPKFLLQCIPLGITGKEKDSYEFAYSWLLPIMRENIQNTELAFFIEYFLPLAQTCKSRVKDQDRVAPRVYDLIQRQIWALLPGFCKFPTDVDAAFKQIAKLLGQCLTDRADVRMDVMAALRQLIIHSKSDEKIKAEITRYAKNYIPILFNLYTTKATSDEEESQRASVYETINYFLQVADAELRHSLFDKAKLKLEAATAALKDDDKTKAEANVFLWDAVLALLRSLVVYQTPERIEAFVATCLPWMTGADPRAQKKAYKIIEETIEAEADTECGRHVRNNLDAVVKLFSQSRESVKPTSRASRLRSLVVIVTLLGDQQGNKANRRFVTLSVTEALAGVKGVGDKLRTAAYKLIIAAGSVFQKWNAKAGLKDYIALLMRGTSKDDEAVAAVTAVTYVVYEFASSCTDDIIDSVLEQVLKLVTTDDREVVLSCLIFIRMFIVTVHSQRLPLYLKRLMDALCDMDDELRRVFLIKTRDILIRLMRKCGNEVVMKLVPEEDEGMLKRLNNIRKVEARKKKKKEELKAADKDVDDEEDADSQVKATQPKTMEHVLADSESELDDDEFEEDEVRKKAPKTWIKEDEEDSVIDLLDPSAARKVTATNPLLSRDAVQLEKKKKRETLFATAPDGRLIIDDAAVSSDSEPEETDNDISQALGDLRVGKKRKQRREEDPDDDEEPSFKYQAGGVGIHRPIAVPRDRKSVKKVTSKERAKMGKQSDEVAKDFGAEYRSGKARGDVKRQGKPDPFAYVTLSRSALNKRKTAKMQGQFKNLVRAARDGAAAGAKIRGKSKAARK